ncbi:MAG TPA: hypothetical protein PKC73_00225 [Dermatophilaceae bacterium]|jgi:hypothetical protein|nr:hypothetical protein [Dermatophilaceae bacterium]HOA03199.1 hypothetical protein [Dermatophilaceae bacterium]
MDLEQRRLQLHEILVGILGNENVYFQPPANLVMQYPCIRYERDRADAKFADNQLYRYTQRYTVTLIDRDPDSDKIFKIASLPLSAHERWYAADNLNHDVFNLYF